MPETLVGIRAAPFGLRRILFRSFDEDEEKSVKFLSRIGRIHTPCRQIVQTVGREHKVDC
jgi:hypothetical protein